MRKPFGMLLSFMIVLVISGCSNEVIFQSQLDGVSLTYDDREYHSISENDCEYEYDSKDMKYLFSVGYGDFSDMGESYNVYRHTDDEDSTYLFLIPKPRIRDVAALSFILKVAVASDIEEKK